MDIINLDLTKLSIEQIAISFVIVGCCVIGLVNIIPKIINTVRMMFGGVRSFVHKQDCKSAQIKQLNKNTKDIEKINSRIDDILVKVNEFIDNNTRVTGEIMNAVNDLKDSQLEIKLERYRSEILDFANSCKHDRTHTPNEFLHIISLGTKYENLIKEYHIDNGVFDAEFEYVKRLYNRLLDENKFLQCGEVNIDAYTEEDER